MTDWAVGDLGTGKVTLRTGQLEMLWTGEVTLRTGQLVTVRNK